MSVIIHDNGKLPSIRSLVAASSARLLFDNIYEDSTPPNLTEDNEYYAVIGRDPYVEVDWAVGGVAREHTVFVIVVGKETNSDNDYMDPELDTIAGEVANSLREVAVPFSLSYNPIIYEEGEFRQQIIITAVLREQA